MGITFDLTPKQRTVKMSGGGKLLEGTGAEIAQSRMPAMTVVPDLNVFEERTAGGRAVREGAVGTVLAELHIRSEIDTIETYLGQFASAAAVSHNLSHHGTERVRSCG
jgi:hypothetical protein